jgi:hypothetical protein
MAEQYQSIRDSQDNHLLHLEVLFQGYITIVFCGVISCYIPNMGIPELTGTGLAICNTKRWVVAIATAPNGWLKSYHGIIRLSTGAGFRNHVLCPIPRSSPQLQP